MQSMPTKTIQQKPILDPYAALRHPNYRAYVIGNFIAVFGQQMLAVAIQWEIYAITNSTLALGFLRSRLKTGQ